MEKLGINLYNLANILEVKVKKLHPDAKLPTYSKEGDAGMDFYALSGGDDNYQGYTEYSTGIALEIPESFVGLIFPRSSISDYNHTLTNSVGVVDSNYRGEIKFRFRPVNNSEYGLARKIYVPGDRIGQLIIMPYPRIHLEEVQELSDTNRGTEGFGSSGT